MLLLVNFGKEFYITAKNICTVLQFSLHILFFVKKKKKNYDQFFFSVTYRLIAVVKQEKLNFFVFLFYLHFIYLPLPCLLCFFVQSVPLGHVRDPFSFESERLFSYLTHFYLKASVPRVNNVLHSLFRQWRCSIIISE